MFVVTAKGKIFELQRNMHGLVVLRAVGRKLRGKLQYLDSTTNEMQVFDGNKWVPAKADQLHVSMRDFSRDPMAPDKVYGVPIVIDDSIPFKNVRYKANAVIMSTRTYEEMLKCRLTGFRGQEAFANELIEASGGARGVT